MPDSGPFAQFETVPMDEFPLKWRFTDPRWDLLPQAHVAQIKPIAPGDARQMWNAIQQAGIQRDMPFTNGYFRSVSSVVFRDWDNPHEATAQIKKWLYLRGLPFHHQVFLSYQPSWAIVTKWKMLIKYWTAFHYPGSDDLMVVDGTFQWALFFDHEEVLYFGTNMESRSNAGRPHPTSEALPLRGPSLAVANPPNSGVHSDAEAGLVPKSKGHPGAGDATVVRPR